MKAARLAPLVLLAACAPGDEAIGATEWATPLDASAFAIAVAGPAGHVAVRTEREVQLFAPDGQLAWSAPCGDACVDPGARMALDEDGALFLTEVHLEQEELELRKLAAADGSLAWSRSFPGERLSPGVLLDGSGEVWMVVVAAGATDLGGGPVGGADREARWVRLDGDGQHLASGALGFVVGPCAAGWPDRAGVVLSGPGCTGAIAIDRDGGVEWREEADEVISFVLGAGGERTLAAVTPDGAIELVRIDAGGGERWRVGLGPWGFNELRAVAGGGLVATRYDGLGSTSDVTFLQRVSGDGELTDREYFVDAWVELIEGPATAGYRMIVGGDDDGEIDLHDRDAEATGNLLVGRRLP